MTLVPGYRTIFLSIADIAIIYVGILLALYLRLDFTGLYEQVTFYNGFLKIAVATAVCTLSLYLHDLYDYSALNDRRELLLRLIQALGIAWIFLALIYYFFPSLMLGRGIAIIAIALSLALLLLFRMAIHFLFGHPFFGEHILVVGDVQMIVDTVTAVHQRRDAGFRIVGYATDDQTDGQLVPNMDVPMLGSINNIERIVSSRRVERIVIGVKERRGSFPAETLLRLRLADSVSIEESTSFFERVTGKVHLDNLRPSWLIFSIHSKRSWVSFLLRGFLQQAVALIGLIVSFPICLVTMVLIRVESPGSCFYKQTRVGKNGRLFTLYKFRSMRENAEADGEPLWASENDDRVTAVGRVIRKIRVDEIPQFWNILKGEMRFIGPRPERPFFVQNLAKEVPFYEYRHIVQPGLTGWAQIKYPYGSSVDDSREKLQYDIYYLKNQSLVLDLIIMIETIKTIIFGRGAR